MKTGEPESTATEEVTAATAPLSLPERIEAQRTQISRAMSIVEACRMGSDSMLAPMHSEDQDGEPDFEGALAAAWDVLDHAYTQLEIIIRDMNDRAAA